MLSVDQEKSNEEYLGKCKVTENDPAILFDWNFEILQQFVEGVNQNVLLPQAFFITTAPGNMTVTSLLNDIMLVLGRVSGGRNGNNLLAPNTLGQALNIRSLLRDIETNAWFQQQFAKFIPVGSFLATVSQIVDRRIANATPSGLTPPHGFRQVFQ